MSLIFATQFSAVATAILAFFAIVTGVFALLAFRKQSEEVRAIEQQVKDAQELSRQQADLLKVQSGQLELQREQLADQRWERRRTQASRVFIWTEIGPDPRRTDEQIEKGVPWREGVTAHISNTSAQPVHELTIDWHRGTAPWGKPDNVLVLMPGEQEDFTRIFPEDLPLAVDLNLFGAVVRFRDAAGVHWLLRASGQLDEEQSPRALPPRRAPR